MIRSSFKRKGFEPKPQRQMDYTPRPRVAAQNANLSFGSSIILAAPKREYVRSEALMALARSQRFACQHCGAMDGTICGAHSNWAVHGKGGHIKADDNRIACLCFACHAALDQGCLTTEDQKKRMWWDAHVATIYLIVDSNAWPPDVPMPNVLDCPFDFAHN